MVFINESQTIGIILTHWNSITGSLFLTLCMIVLLILIVFAILGLSLEWSALFIMPLLLALMAYSDDFFSIGGAFLLYTSFLLAKNFFFGK